MLYLYSTKFFQLKTSMIPAFTKEGYLPQGIHTVSIKELESRFSTNIVRKDLFSHLIKLIEDLKLIKCSSVYIDGSFTTNKRSPNDVDVCWDNRGIDYNNAITILPILFDFSDGRRNQQAKYKCDIFPAYETEGATGILFIDFFQKDKATGNRKGIIEVKIKKN